MTNITKPTEAQLKFAVKISDSTGIEIPGEVYSNKFELSKWIDENKTKIKTDEMGRMVFKPSCSQVAFAENIAKVLGLKVPQECYQKASAVSEWITEHKEKFTEEQRKHPTEKMINFAKSIYKHHPECGDPAYAFDSTEELSEWITRNKPEGLGGGGK